MLDLTHISTTTEMNQWLENASIHEIGYLLGRLNDKHWYTRIYTIISGKIDKRELVRMCEDALMERALFNSETFN